MRLVVFDREGRDRLGAVVAPDWVADVHSALGTGDHLSGILDFLVGGDKARANVADVVAMARHLLDQGERSEWLLRRNSLRLRPPVAPTAKVIATGRNFIAHLLEANADRRARGEAEVPVPEAPTAFAKLRSTLAGHEETVPYPAGTAELDYEGEVACVIGRRALNMTAADAMDHIAGYVIFNDLSARDVQRYEVKVGLLLLGKNFPAFGPIGPEFVTADEVENPHELRIRTRVNGALRQDGSTHEMHFRWPDLVAYWSQVGLEPGDLIASGTPSGVAMGRSEEWFLRPGDEVEVEVEGLGLLRTLIGPTP